jgi:hypothetical protein
MNHVSPAEEILEVVEIEIFALEEKPLPRAVAATARASVSRRKLVIDLLADLSGQQIRQARLPEASSLTAQ